MAIGQVDVQRDVKVRPELEPELISHFFHTSHQSCEHLGHENTRPASVSVPQPN